MDYKSAGVDIEAGYESVELMKEHVKKTMREEVLRSRGFPEHFLSQKLKIWKSRYCCPVRMAAEPR